MKLKIGATQLVSFPHAFAVGDNGLGIVERHSQELLGLTGTKPGLHYVSVP